MGRLQILGDDRIGEALVAPDEIVDGVSRPRQEIGALLLGALAFGAVKDDLVDDRSAARPRVLPRLVLEEQKISQHRDVCRLPRHIADVVHQAHTGLPSSASDPVTAVLLTIGGSRPYHGGHPN
jgi:hypothetical protein